MSYTNADIEIKARMIADDVDDDILHLVCAAAAAELEARLRRGVDREKIRELFVTAAGVLAISLYMELAPDEAGNIRSFKAGNIYVSLDDLSSAHKLRACAENMLCAYFDNGGFDFRGVPS